MRNFYIGAVIGTIVGTIITLAITYKSLENKVIIWNDDPESFHPEQMRYEMTINDTIYIGPIE